jgi:hypothetical protein
MIAQLVKGDADHRYRRQEREISKHNQISKIAYVTLRLSRLSPERSATFC